MAYCELDDALGLTITAAQHLQDARRRKNGWHAVVGPLRPAVFGRLAGYEDVNDAERLSQDPAMRWIGGGGSEQYSKEGKNAMFADILDRINRLRPRAAPT